MIAILWSSTITISIIWGKVRADQNYFIVGYAR